MGGRDTASQLNLRNRCAARTGTWRPRDAQEREPGRVDRVEVCGWRQGTRTEGWGGGASGVRPQGTLSSAEALAAETGGAGRPRRGAESPSAPSPGAQAETPPGPVARPPCGAVVAGRGAGQVREAGPGALGGSPPAPPRPARPHFSSHPSFPGARLTMFHTLSVSPAHTKGPFCSAQIVSVSGIRIYSRLLLKCLTFPHNFLDVLGGQSASSLFEFIAQNKPFSPL